MSPDTILRARRMMWLSLGLTAAYALVTAYLLCPPASEGQDLLMGQGLFTGPMIVSAVLSMLMRRVEARRTLLRFGIAYSIMTAGMFSWTFGFEHDAQYQLTLLLIPVLGYPAVAVAGLAAGITR
jgi:ABC-type cobalamin transport system permease subunit